MHLFKVNKNSKEPLYDIENEKPVIRVSICTGEKVAGFQNIHNGKFKEVMLISNEADLQLFRSTYHITDNNIPKIY